MDHGSFALTGQAINFKKTANLEAGSFAVTGQDLTTRFEGSVALDQGSIALTGQAATFEVKGFFRRCRELSLLQGKMSDLAWRLISALDAGSFSLTGFDANAKFTEA